MSTISPIAGSSARRWRITADRAGADAPVDLSVLELVGHRAGPDGDEEARREAEVDLLAPPEPLHRQPCLFGHPTKAVLRRVRHAVEERHRWGVVHGVMGGAEGAAVVEVEDTVVLDVDRRQPEMPETDVQRIEPQFPSRRPADPVQIHDHSHPRCLHDLMVDIENNPGIRGPHDDRCPASCRQTHPPDPAAP